VISRLAVRHVELGAKVGVVAAHGGVVVVERRGIGAVRPGEGDEDRIVIGGPVDLESVRIQEQFRGRVVVDEEHGLHAAHQAIEGSRLGLRVRRRPAVRLVAGIRRAALVVIAPAGREVPVRIDSVDTGLDHAIAVVVSQVLAPETVARRERVVVAVGVRHRDEPQLACVDEVGDGGVRAVAVDEVVHEASTGLRREPLASMLGRHVEDRWSLAGALADAEGEDGLALNCRP
jgi:hypothetical protein